nr:hypothetical protein [Tanacetum cinerariifolium]
GHYSTGGNADGTGVRGARPTIPELTGCTYTTFTKCDPLPFNGTEGAIDKADEATEGKKRKGEGNRGSRGDNQREHNRHQNQRRGNAGAMTNVAPNNNETCQKCKNKRHAGDYWKCIKCGKLGHKTKRCWISKMSCYNCHEKGHRKKDCPKLGRNGQGGNNRGGSYQLGAVNAQEDPKVVTGTFLLNNHSVTALFDSVVNRSFVSTKFSTLINIKPVEIDTSYEV